MGHERPDRETRDQEGSTKHYNGTVGTSSTAIPASPGAVISEVSIKAGANSGKLLQYSFDGGTNFDDLRKYESIIWTPKGNLTQIHIKGSDTGVEYKILMNVEPT